jgi:hypothetical protein
MMQDTTNGIDPHECELEDGVPEWMYGLMLLILFALTWLFARGK